jgi:phage terminase small subunit
MASKITAQQKAFISEYVKTGFNATQAAINAGYSKKTARNSAARLLSKDNIQEAIEKKVKRHLSNLDEYGLKLLKTIEHAAFLDPRNLFSWRNGELTFKDSNELTTEDAAMVTEISVTPGKYGTHQKVKLVSKEQAWQILARFSKLIDRDADDDGRDEKQERTPKEKRERLAYLLNKAK